MCRCSSSSQVRYKNSFFYIKSFKKREKCHEDKNELLTNDNKNNKIHTNGKKQTQTLKKSFFFCQSI